MYWDHEYPGEIRLNGEEIRENKAMVPVELGLFIFRSFTDERV